MNATESCSTTAARTPARTIVEHHAETARQPSVRPRHRPRFGDVEERGTARSRRRPTAAISAPRPARSIGRRIRRARMPMHRRRRPRDTHDRPPRSSHRGRDRRRTRVATASGRSAKQEPPDRQRQQTTDRTGRNRCKAAAESRRQQHERILQIGRRRSDPFGFSGNGGILRAAAEPRDRRHATTHRCRHRSCRSPRRAPATR